MNSGSYLRLRPTSPTARSTTGSVALAADGFLVALEHAFELIAAAPNRWPQHRRGTRRFVLQTYPYSVIYRVVEGTVWVIAVAHFKRRPGYWRRRSR